MWNGIRLWIGKRYQKIINSIAFYPALIAFLFLILSFLLISFDFSDYGKQLKSNLHWLSLKDASTARSIISSIVSGIISLTVFSFSMVMIILNQTASQMSNRILDNLIGNRFQQIVLGIYIGTIVFALFLLSTIRDIDSGIYIPAISTYVLIVLTVVDIFLFIYFLHFITQSVKYNVIIERIYKETLSKMKEYCYLQEEPAGYSTLDKGFILHAKSTGIYQGFNKHNLLRLCNENDCTIQLLKSPGTFVYNKTPLLKVSKALPRDVTDQMVNTLYLHDDESVENNFFYGFRQLMEVAVKALSPGINDPGTAVQSLRALSKLFIYRIHHFPSNTITDKNGNERIIIKELTIEEMFAIGILPVWDYGKDDRMIQIEMLHMLTHMRSITDIPLANKLFEEVSVLCKKDSY